MADEDDLVEAFTAEDPTVMQEESHLALLKRKSSKRCCIISFIVVAICLAVTVVVVVALAVALAMGNSEEHKPTTSPSDVCLTESCVQLAAKVLSGLDQSINPCQDFYNFTCGNWIYNTIIPQDSVEYDANSILDDLNTQRLTTIMEGPTGNDVDALVKAKDLYRSCMNTNLTNQLGLQPLLDVLAISGGWALIGQDVTIPWDLNGEAFLTEKMYGSPAFFTLLVDLDEMKPSQFIIHVQESGLTLEHAYQYAHTDRLKAYIVQILNALNPDIDNATYVAAADGIVQLETNLAMICEDFDGPTYNKYTLGELATLWPDFHWVDQANVSFTNAGVNDVDENEPIILRTPYYFGNLTKALQKFDKTILENYAKWQLVHTYLPFLDDKCVAAYNNLKKATTGSVEFTSRTELCNKKVEGALPLSVARLYAEYILPEGAMDLAADMTTEVTKAFRQRVETRVWLDEATRERAIRKVDLMGQLIAYPDRIFDNDWLNGLYSEYMISSESFFENNVQIKLFVTTVMLAQLRNPVDLWTKYPLPPDVTPTIVNAVYYPSLNAMIILEGIMGTPYFQPEWPGYFKYGGLGTVIGHEITHGFDSKGRLYNETGQLEDWWTEASVTNFVDGQQCFIDQYSEYGYYGMNVNGSQTLGENIADNGGIRASYNAYKSHLERTGKSPPTLPGVNYTPDQLYFIAFAQVYCTYYTERAYKFRILEDRHSPGPFRVIGTLMNSPEFAEAFQCPEGSPMNPKDKCSLW